MKKLPFNKDELYRRYINILNRHLNVFESISSVGPEFICWIITSIFLMSGRFIDNEKLYELYVKKISKIEFPKESDKINEIRFITDIIYDIIEENELLLSRFETLKRSVKHLFKW